MHLKHLHGCKTETKVIFNGDFVREHLHALWNQTRELPTRIFFHCSLICLTGFRPPPGSHPTWSGPFQVSCTLGGLAGAAIASVSAAGNHIQSLSIFKEWAIGFANSLKLPSPPKSLMVLSVSGHFSPPSELKSGSPLSSRGQLCVVKNLMGLCISQS